MRRVYVAVVIGALILGYVLGVTTKTIWDPVASAWPTFHMQEKIEPQSSVTEPAAPQSEVAPSPDDAAKTPDETPRAAVQPDASYDGPGPRFCCH